jgi:ubiquinone/menaquinone biosynthesis C-methylase UbiE
MSGKDNYLATGFCDVDRADISKMMQCLDDLQSLACFQHYKDRTLDLLTGSMEASALDVACGLGDDVVRLKQRFGRAIGLDASTKLVAEAIRRHQGEGCEFCCADAKSLPFAAEEFDAVRVDRSLQHIQDPIAVVREMTRVTRKGGVILCAEPDWGTFFIGEESTAVTRAIKDRWIQSFQNPWIGRNLFGMMKAAGIGSLSIEAHLLLTKGFAASDLVFDLTKTAEKVGAEMGTAAGVSAWLDGYKKSEAIAGVTLIICYGTKV